MRRLWVAVALAALVQSPAANAQAFRAVDEARVLAMVNSTRASRGLPALLLNPSLVTLAREQSAQMVDENNLFHNPNLKAGLDALGLDWAWSGENVGIGPDVDAVQRAFLDSQHHLENIIRRNYNSIGVGVLGASSGHVYVTQVFAEVRSAVVPAVPAPPPTVVPAPPATPSPAPAPAPVSPSPPKPDLVVIEGGVVAPQPALP